MYDILFYWNSAFYFYCVFSLIAECMRRVFYWAPYLRDIWLQLNVASFISRTKFCYTISTNRAHPKKGCFHALSVLWNLVKLLKAFILSVDHDKLGITLCCTIVLILKICIIYITVQLRSEAACSKMSNDTGRVHNDMWHAADMCLTFAKAFQLLLSWIVTF